ncbi:polysaccharide deacetylase family protein [Glycomyces sp. TRM65418]|uniref:polysaccharide deacetylase family protein n=1 Tax=Glycomyces sp. TRM65418 TaxID=2867006 RepID=UPI001CE527F1|nr:polysaccharide deacetylase family protein [Glycomyces sp. TRM65418]MCC3765909.1 polysaccharide deacetylase family protein [Glycomyces sp. TRM65418]QZD55491.1 polysaccharide deacetylase family protein [Glycomyces sp. TRM65418]
MRSRMRTLIASLSAFTVALGAAAVVLSVAASPAQAQACNGYVALTFDDGPNPSSTDSLLNALASNGLRATMFNTGQNAAANPGLVRAQVNAGMWVGNHSYTHPHMTQLSQSQMASEISRTQQAIQSAGGGTPVLFRPPYGETNATLKSVEAQYGLTEVLWSVDSRDWNGATTAQIVQAARGLQNGGVMLMHDSYRSTINAIPQIAADLRSRGLCAGMISPSTGRAVAPDGSGGGGGTETDLLRSTSAGKCIDVPGGSTAAGVKVQLYSCYEGANQQFTYTAAQELRILGRCLEAPSGGNGTQVQINACSNTAGQRWTFGSDGTIRSVGYGNACLDVYSSSNGAPVQLYGCWGGDNQRWTRV